MKITDLTQGDVVETRNHDFFKPGTILFVDRITEEKNIWKEDEVLLYFTTSRFSKTIEPDDYPCLIFEPNEKVEDYFNIIKLV